MFRFDRPVRWYDVDAARVVFFARVHEYCHEALEALFGELPGGYARLTMEQDLGIPTVRLETDYLAPLRYGDVVGVEVEVLAIGTRSITFHHTIRRLHDGVVCVRVRHVVVTARISTFSGVPVPDIIRAVVERHLVAGESQA